MKVEPESANQRADEVHKLNTTGKMAAKQSVTTLLVHFICFTSPYFKYEISQ